MIKKEPVSTQDKSFCESHESQRAPPPFFLTVLTNRAGRRSEGVPHAGHNEAAVPSQPVLFWFSCCGGV